MEGISEEQTINQNYGAVVRTLVEPRLWLKRYQATRWCKVCMYLYHVCNLQTNIYS